MQFNLRVLSVAVSMAMVPSLVIADEDADAKIAKLEQQVQTLQSQQTANLADKFNFNGFISGAYISSDNDAGYNGADSSANFSEQSKFGFQGTFNISDRTQAVLQLMMRGDNDWEVEAEWAYLSHRFENNLQVRGGKLRLPIYMYSDYLDVGYAQLFANPPVEVYAPFPPSFTGGDLSYNFEFDDSTLTVQAFGGENNDSGSIFSLNNLMGTNISWTDETWTLRGIYAQANLDGSIVNGDYTILELDDEAGVFMGVGASYDDGKFIAITEWTRVEIDNAFPDSDSGYLTLGYRINSLTPYATVAYTKTQDNDERLPLSTEAAIQMIAFNSEHTAYSLGLRWDAIDNVAIKFDLTYVDDFGDTSGGLNGNSYDMSSGQFAYDDTLVYTVKFDAVF